VRKELFVTSAVVQHAQRIQWAETRGKVELTAPRKQVGRRTQIAASEGCVELTEEVCEPPHILLGSVMDDVEVLRRDRSAVKHSGSSSDHDELDARSQKSLDQGIEISLNGMRHP